MNPWPLPIKMVHMRILHWIWTDRMHQAYPISKKDCLEAKAKFAKNPADPSLRDFKRGANRLWMIYVQGN
jgi:hypothetical protein